MNITYFEILILVLKSYLSKLLNWLVLIILKYISDKYFLIETWHLISGLIFFFFFRWKTFQAKKWHSREKKVSHERHDGRK